MGFKGIFQYYSVPIIHVYIGIALHTRDKNRSASTGANFKHIIRILYVCTKLLCNLREEGSNGCRWVFRGGSIKLQYGKISISRFNLGGFGRISVKVFVSWDGIWNVLRIRFTSHNTFSDWFFVILFRVHIFLFGCEH